MNTRNYHAHMRIRICIVNDQNEWMRTWAANNNTLSRNGISAQLMNTKYSPCISECKTELKQNTISTIIASQRWLNIGPQQSPIYCSWANLTNPVFLNYEGITIAYIKSRRSEDYLRTEMRLKTIRMKTGLLGFIWKLEYLELNFED